MVSRIGREGTSHVLKGGDMENAIYRHKLILEAFAWTKILYMERNIVYTTDDMLKLKIECLDKSTLSPYIVKSNFFPNWLSACRCH